MARPPLQDGQQRTSHGHFVRRTVDGFQVCWPPVPTFASATWRRLTSTPTAGKKSLKTALPGGRQWQQGLSVPRRDVHPRYRRRGRRGNRKQQRPPLPPPPPCLCELWQRLSRKSWAAQLQSPLQQRQFLVAVHRRYSTDKCPLWQATRGVTQDQRSYHHHHLSMTVAGHTKKDFNLQIQGQFHPPRTNVTSVLVPWEILLRPQEQNANDFIATFLILYQA